MNPDFAAPVRGRFAPSPTGTLHLGNLRTALLAWLFARQAGGAFILRIEDLDRPRNRLHATRQLLADLRWLGLDWDEGPDIGGPTGPYFQTQRAALYLAALARLRDQDLLYPCYCSRAELARIASAPQRPGDDGQRYPGTCRTLTARQRAQHEASGRRPAWRFHAPNHTISYVDHSAGAMIESVASTTGDFVVQRSDGVIAYQLAVVVDDAWMGVTQVVRGADLRPSTARQLALYDALKFKRPLEYAHVPLAVDARGDRLAKRDLAAGVDTLRAEGIPPSKVVGALAASCGIWPAGEPAMVQDLLAVFDPARITASASRIEL